MITLRVDEQQNADRRCRWSASRQPGEELVGSGGVEPPTFAFRETCFRRSAPMWAAAVRSTCNIGATVGRVTVTQSAVAFSPKNAIVGLMTPAEHADRPTVDTPTPAGPPRHTPGAGWAKLRALRDGRLAEPTVADEQQADDLLDRASAMIAGAGPTRLRDSERRTA